MSRSFRKILAAFGASDEEIDRELAKNYFNRQTNASSPSKEVSTTSLIYPSEIKFPKNTKKLQLYDDDYVWKQVAIEYLKMRGLTQDSYHFYLSEDPYYENRIIIPYFRNGKLIYWQARLFDDTVKKQRYLNAEIDKSSIFFNFDQIFEHSQKPLFVTEGVFDAIHINAVCIAGSELSNNHVSILNKSSRDKIFVIDKDLKGYKLGKKVIDLGYNITWIDGSVADINDSVVSMGKLWTVQNLLSNVSSGLSAKIWLENMIKGKKVA
jgi:hypothetical protein